MKLIKIKLGQFVVVLLISTSILLTRSFLKGNMTLSQAIEGEIFIIFLIGIFSWVWKEFHHTNSKCKNNNSNIPVHNRFRQKKHYFTLNESSIFLVFILSIFIGLVYIPHFFIKPPTHSPFAHPFSESFILKNRSFFSPRIDKVVAKILTLKAGGSKGELNMANTDINIHISEDIQPSFMQYVILPFKPPIEIDYAEYPVKDLLMHMQFEYNFLNLKITQSFCFRLLPVDEREYRWISSNECPSKPYSFSLLSPEERNKDVVPTQPNEDSVGVKSTQESITQNIPTTTSEKFIDPNEFAKDTWKTYWNENWLSHSIAFKYPPDWNLEENRRNLILSKDDTQIIIDGGVVAPCPTCEIEGYNIGNKSAKASNSVNNGLEVGANGVKFTIRVNNDNEQIFREILSTVMFHLDMHPEDKQFIQPFTPIQDKPIDANSFFEVNAYWGECKTTKLLSVLKSNGDIAYSEPIIANGKPNYKPFIKLASVDEGFGLQTIVAPYLGYLINGFCVTTPSSWKASLRGVESLTLLFDAEHLPDRVKEFRIMTLRSNVSLENSYQAVYSYELSSWPLVNELESITLNILEKHGENDVLFLSSTKDDLLYLRYFLKNEDTLYMYMVTVDMNIPSDTEYEVFLQELKDSLQTMKFVPITYLSVYE